MKSNTNLLLRAEERFGTPLYVYEQAVVEGQCRKLTRAFPQFAFHYAMKANSNPAILDIIRKEGIGVESVSIGELMLAKKVGFKTEDTSFTCSNMTEKELALAAKSGVLVHLDSLAQLEWWGRQKGKFGKNVSVRLNLGIGAGHHEHVITGGPTSKFGITSKDIPEAKRIASEYGLSITGIQQHIGSNVLDYGIFLKGAEQLLKAVEKFPDVTHIDFGGGLGIPYQPDEKPLNLEKLGKALGAACKAFEKKIGRKVAFAMEPGRFLVAEAGTLLAMVVDRKATSKRDFVGVNSGFSHLIRPAMYGSYHPIENITRTRGKKASVSVTGNICETGDVFGHDRLMISPEPGDVLAIRNSGAYGFSMAMPYNLRKLPKEVLVTGGEVRDISFSPSLYAR